MKLDTRGTSELPYDFDLLYDIKMMHQVEAIAKGEASHSDASPEDLVELFEELNMKLPECLHHIRDKHRQSKLESRIEVACNYASGFLLAYLIYSLVVFPNEWLKNQPFLLTSLFTSASIIRSYYWRRFFNAELHKWVHTAITQFFVKFK
jgi:hypothetical protein